MEGPARKVAVLPDVVLAAAKVAASVRKATPGSTDDACPMLSVRTMTQVRSSAIPMRCTRPVDVRVTRNATLFESPAPTGVSVDASVALATFAWAGSV